MKKSKSLRNEAQNIHAALQLLAATAKRVEKTGEWELCLRCDEHLYTPHPWVGVNPTSEEEEVVAAFAAAWAAADAALAPRGQAVCWINKYTGRTGISTPIHE